MTYEIPEAGNDEFSYGHIEFEVSLGHPDGDKYMVLKLEREVCAEDINWRVISIQIVVILLKENIYNDKMNE